MENVLITKDGGIAVITINRPDFLNALNTPALSDLASAFDDAAADEGVNVIIITGAGRAFVAGADVSEMANMNMVEGRAFGMVGQQLYRRIECCEKPVIAAVNGYALGGGCELAMACDIRIASEYAIFGQPEVGLGITPGFSGTQRLARIVGKGRATELILTTDNINADEAYRIGLANKVVPADKLMDEARAMAEKIASKGQLAVRWSNSAIRRGLEADSDTGIAIEADLFGMCFGTEDQKEGMKAFLEKRKPEFKGR